MLAVGLGEGLWLGVAVLWLGTDVSEGTRADKVDEEPGAVPVGLVQPVVETHTLITAAIAQRLMGLRLLIKCLPVLKERDSIRISRGRGSRQLAAPQGRSQVVTAARLLLRSWRQIAGPLHDPHYLPFVLTRVPSGNSVTPGKPDSAIGTLNFC